MLHFYSGKLLQIHSGVDTFDETRTPTPSGAASQRHPMTLGSEHRVLGSFRF
jgi:hypothetical protein